MGKPACKGSHRDRVLGPRSKAIRESVSIHAGQGIDNNEHDCLAQNTNRLQTRDLARSSTNTMPHIRYHPGDWTSSESLSSSTNSAQMNVLHVGHGRAFSDWNNSDKASWFNVLQAHFSEAAANLPTHDLSLLAHPSLITNKQDRKKAAAFMSCFLEGVVRCLEYT